MSVIGKYASTLSDKSRPSQGRRSERKPSAASTRGSQRTTGSGYASSVTEQGRFAGTIGDSIRLINTALKELRTRVEKPPSSPVLEPILLSQLPSHLTSSLVRPDAATSSAASIVHVETVSPASLEISLANIERSLKIQLTNLTETIQAAIEAHTANNFTQNQVRQLNHLADNVLQAAIAHAHKISSNQQLSDYFRSELKPQLKALKDSLNSLIPPKVISKTTPDLKPVIVESPQILSNDSVPVTLAKVTPRDSLDDSLAELREWLKTVIKSTFEFKEYTRVDITPKAIKEMSDPVKKAVMGLLLRTEANPSSAKEPVHFIDLHGAQALLQHVSSGLDKLVHKNLDNADIPTLEKIRSFIEIVTRQIKEIATFNKRDFPLSQWSEPLVNSDHKVGLVRSGAKSVALQVPDAVMNGVEFSEAFKSDPLALYTASQSLLKQSVEAIQAQTESILTDVYKRTAELELKQQQRLTELAREQSRSEAAAKQMIEGKKFMQTLKSGSPEDLFRALKGRVASAKESSKPGAADLIGDHLYKLRKDFQTRFQSNPKATADDATKLAMLTKACALIQEHLAQSVTYQRKDGGRATPDYSWLSKLSSAV